MFNLLQIDAADSEVLKAGLNAALAGKPASLLIATGNVASMKTLKDLEDPQRFSANWIACSSCIGAASSFGVDQISDRRLTFLVVEDHAGSYGVASVKLTEGQITQQAAATVKAAILRAGRPAELPALIWCMQAPGFEEQIIAGIQQIVGDQVPILGGSAADDAVTGDWCQYDGQQLAGNLLVIAVLYPTVAISSYFSSGYSTEPFSGTVTEVQGRRITKINDQSALEIYNSWLQQTGAPPQAPGQVMSDCTFYPLGRQLAAKDIPFSLLSLPTNIHSDGGIETLSEIQPGEVVTLMSGAKEQLVRRASHVVRVATNNLRLRHHSEPAAALIVYCAGCMLAVRDEIEQVQQSLSEALADMPYLVAFTFGEQGCFADGFNRHGNLMISAVLFGQPQPEHQP